MLGILIFSSVNAYVKADKEALEAYNKGISMLFTQNVGQLSDEVLFYSLHPSVVYVLRDGTLHINGVRVSFKSKPRFITGDMQLITKVSYFGRNKSISDIPTYKRVVLKEVYPNIDAILTADGRGVVEFQFIVHPGGDPEDIRVESDGDIVQREEGIYIVKDGKEVVRISGLKAYQGAEEVEVRVDVKGKEAKFIVDDWDRKHTLVIDPVATAILTSSDEDKSNAVTVSASGEIFLAGYTLSYTNFSDSRTTFGSVSGYQDAFVSKLSGDLGTHLATAIVMSDQWDEAFAVAVDSLSNVFIAGWTGNATNFSESRNIFGTPSNYDAFITKLSYDLMTHLATAILASTGSDVALSISISGGEVFIAGRASYYLDFPGSGPVFGTVGSSEAFVSKMNSDLSNIIATAIIASDGMDYARSITLDMSGNVILVGSTENSSNFSDSRLTFGTTGGYDAFVSKLSNDLQTHIATAILASSSRDEGNSVFIDGSGNIFVAGFTYNSSDFAPSRNVFGTSGWDDAFISKLSGDLTTHIATAILTSNAGDYAYSVVIDSSGDVFVAGITGNSSNFAPNRSIFGTTGFDDAFVSKLSNDLATHISTAILASSSDDIAYSIALDNSGNILVSGGTWNSSDFAPSRVIFGTPSPGYWDAFVSRLPNTLSVLETPKTLKDANIEISKGNLIFNLRNSSYLGFDVYDASGKLVKRVSLGYLPAGRYEYFLNLPKGVYTVKVRIGYEVKEIKGVF